MNRHRRLLAGVLAVIALGSCSIQPDEGPRQIAQDERGQLGRRPTGDAAAGTNRIFLVTSTTEDQPARLRSVLRAVPNDPAAIMLSLLAGENQEEREAQLTSFLPDGLELLTARARGPVLTVSLTDQFGDLSADALRLAVAQLVATGSEIENIERIRLQIDGVNQVWPVGNGENTDQPLTVFDYPGFVESSQSAFPAVPALSA